MAEQFIQIEFDSSRTLRDQVREHLVTMILSDQFPSDSPLPSSRNMAVMLGVSRNTITQIYEDLVDMEYLEARPRQGYFVNTQLQDGGDTPASAPGADDSQPVDWFARFKTKPGNKRNIVKPSNWSRFEYPFIYGQVEPDSFPERHWRECGIKAMAGGSSQHWARDVVDRDDSLLIEQLRSKILPRRGIYADASEILVTIGTQNSLYLIANLLMNRSTRVGMEDPGFPDAKNIFSTFGADLNYFPVDRDGLVVDAEQRARLQQMDYLYITPSHQVPTGAVLSSERRNTLLQMAEDHDMVLIEDDYDAEINLQQNVQPAMRAMDRNNRVIYIGSVSKAIAPGLRLGFMVADEELISEARALRRLMYRHPPVFNQRQLALFFSLGYYNTYLRKVREQFEAKLKAIEHATAIYLPGFRALAPSSGASSLWLQAPAHIDTEQLSWRAAKNGILIEPGAVHFASTSPPRNYIRLGFSAIPLEKIVPGIQALGRLVND